MSFDWNVNVYIISEATIVFVFILSGDEANTKHVLS